MKDAASFVRNYRSEDETAIRFAWNRQNGEKFEDANFLNRDEVLLIVMKTPELAPLELIRALFRAETEWAKESWSVRHKAVLFLAQEMLIRGKEAAALDYLEGKMTSMDASLTCACVKLPLELWDRLFLHCQSLAKQTNSQSDQRLIDEGLRFFGGMAEEMRKSEKA